MADHTIVNLREVEDQAPKFGFSEVQLLGGPGGALSGARSARRLDWARLSQGEPRQAPGFAHRHKDAEEIYVILSGSGRVKLDDEVREVRAMDAIRAAPEVVRAFEGGPDGLELLAFGPRHDGDGDILREGFWGD